MRGDTWNVRMARSEEEMTMFLVHQILASRSRTVGLLANRVECDLSNGGICNLEAMCDLIISSILLKGEVVLRKA